MRFDGVPASVRKQAYGVLMQRAQRSGAEPVVKYLDCGTRMVRLVCHSPAFLRHVERQMTCSLRDHADAYDVTLVIWQDRDVTEAAFALMSAIDRNFYNEHRLARLVGKPVAPIDELQVYDESLIRYWPLFLALQRDHMLSACDPETKTYYYAVENLEPEEFIKLGHIFVQLLFRICDVPGSCLVHGAVVGVEDKGVLICAFGYRGKSTLSVHALLNGFDYVSDDYLVLGQKPGDALRAWPIYSIVALSPQAYDAIYADFRGKFLSNNGRKDKYMFNIAAYHDQFRRAYPVRVCMFPNICDCTKPTIEPGYRQLGIEELAFSTLNNFGNMRDAATIGKIFDFIKDMPFYRFNLSRNIANNTQCLKEFLEQL